MSETNNKKRKALNCSDDAIRPEKKRKTEMYLENKEELIIELQTSFESSQDLQKQQKRYGPLLKTAIPLYDAVPVISYLPYFSQEKLHKFYEALDQTHQDLDPSNNRLVAVVQTGCSGKRELCIAAGIDPSTDYYMILIDFKITIKWLSDKIGQFIKLFDPWNESEEISFDSETHERKIRWSELLIQIYVLAHIEWAMEIADEFKEDKIQARMACITALTMNDGLKGITDSLDERWTEFSTIDLICESHKYVNTLFEEIQQKIGDARRPLVVFEHVSLIRNPGISDSKNTVDIVLYEAFTNVLRKLIEIPNWKICGIDGNRDTFNILEAERVIPFSDLPKITVEDMEKTLHSLFDVNLADAKSDLKFWLEKLCGRPYYFSRLLQGLFYSLTFKTDHTSENFLEELVAMAERTFNAQSSTCERLLDYYKERTMIIRNHRTSKFIAQVYIATVIQDQDHFVIDDDNILTDLVKSDLVMSNSTHGKQIIRRKDEPMLFEAVQRHVESKRDYYRHLINDEIINPSYPIITNVYDMKGRVTEYLLAWFFRQRTYCSDPTTLFHLFRDLVPPYFNLPCNIRFCTTSISSVYESARSTDLALMVQKKTYDRILLNHNLSSEVLFLFKTANSKTLEPITGIGVISCKPWKTESFADAVRRVDPRFVLSQADQALLEKQSLDETVLDCEIEAEESEFEQILKINKKYWVRIIYSSEPFPAHLVQQVNVYNEYNWDDPVILITMTNDWLNEEAKEYLRAHEPRQIIF